MSEIQKQNQKHILEHLKDLSLQLDVVLAGEEKTLKEMLYAVPGTVICFNKKITENVDLSLNGKKIAEGEVVSSGEFYGLKIVTVCQGEAKDV